MKVKLLVIPAIFLCALSYSQKMSLLVAPEVSFPNGNFGITSGPGVGLSVRVERRFSKRVYGMGSLDGISFSEKYGTPFPLVTTKVGIETFQAGARFNLIGEAGKQFYLGGELGISGTYFRLSTGVSKSSSYETDFSYRVSLGYIVKRWDINGSQQFISSSSSSLNYFSVRVGYFLKFRN